MARLVGFGVALLVGVLAVSVLTLLLFVAGGFGLYRLGRWGYSWRRDELGRREHARRGLLARAELQHRWYLDGDPRDTYGRYRPSV